MFLIFSILAVSIDGFISGFVIAGIGINFDFKDLIKSLGVIFICCIAASFMGQNLAVIYAKKYINILGVLVMLYLAWHTLFITDDSDGHLNIYTIAMSVAADAGIVCIYLAMDGYNLFLISTLSALMHSVLMAAGAKISNIIIKEHRESYTRYTSAAIFLCMALYKLSEL